MSRADDMFRRAGRADQRVFGETAMLAGATVPAIVERSAARVELFGLVDAERVDATIELQAEHADLGVYGALVSLDDGTRWLIGARLKRDSVSAVFALREDQP